MDLQVITENFQYIYFTLTSFLLPPPPKLYRIIFLHNLNVTLDCLFSRLVLIAYNKRIKLHGKLLQNFSWINFCQLWLKCVVLDVSDTIVLCFILLLAFLGPCHNKSNNGYAGIAGYRCYGYRCPVILTSLLI